MKIGKKERGVDRKTRRGVERRGERRREEWREKDWRGARGDSKKKGGVSKKRRGVSKRERGKRWNRREDMKRTERVVFYRTIKDFFTYGKYKKTAFNSSLLTL